MALSAISVLPRVLVRTILYFPMFLQEEFRVFGCLRVKLEAHFSHENETKHAKL